MRITFVYANRFMMRKTKNKIEKVTFIKFDRKPRTDITISIPMNNKDIYCLHNQTMISADKYYILVY